MTNTPIHRIPLEADSSPLHQIVQAELNGRQTTTAAELLAALHYSRVRLDGGVLGNSALTQEQALTCLLDWAMQIRSELGIDWASSLNAASVLYFG